MKRQIIAAAAVAAAFVIDIGSEAALD